MVCSNSTMIGARPHISTFHLACSLPELWQTLRAAVRPTAARAGALTLDQKRSGSEAIMLRVALEDVKSLLLEVELVARLPISGQKWT